MESQITDDLEEALENNPELAGDYRRPPRAESQATPQPATATSDSNEDQSEPLQEGRPETSNDFTVDPTQTVPPHRNDKTPGPPAASTIGNLGHVSLSPTLKPEEFDSDEDVATCLLSEAETRIKERVWVTMNADWLRKDHAKRIRKELRDAEMRANGLDPVEEERKKNAQKGKRKDGTKRPGRRGDVSYLKEQGEGRKGKGAAEGAAEDEREDEDAGGNVAIAETGIGTGATPPPKRTATVFGESYV